MSFSNDTEFQDDFRKVGADVTAGFERPGAPSDPTDHASSENLEVAPKNGADPDLDEEDDLDEDEDLDDEDDEDDLDDEDLEDEDDEEDEDDLEDEDDDEDDDLEDDDEEEAEDDDDEIEDDEDGTKARLKDAETRARAK